MESVQNELTRRANQARKDHELATRILNAIARGKMSPETHKWAEVIESMDLFCWTYGFDFARQNGRPSRISYDDFDQAWFRAYAIVREAWIVKSI